MNANELADKLANTYNKVENFDQDVIDAVIMLRQQQAEIEALKNRYEPAKTITDDEIIDIWLPFATDGIKGKIAFARAILRKAQEK